MKKNDIDKKILQIKGLIRRLLDQQKQIDLKKVAIIREIKNHKNDIKKLEEQKKDTIGLKITDHAILRYIENVLNIDIDFIKNELKDVIDNCELIEGQIQIKNNIFAKVQNRTITTIIKEKNS
jgi:hypothetical protein